MSCIRLLSTFIKLAHLFTIIFSTPCLFPSTLKNESCGRFGAGFLAVQATNVTKARTNRVHRCKTLNGISKDSSDFPTSPPKKKMHKALCNMSSQRWHLRSVAPHNSRCLARLFSGPAAKLSCKPCSAQNWTAKECALAKKRSFGKLGKRRSRRKNRMKRISFQ